MTWRHLTSWPVAILAAVIVYFPVILAEPLGRLEGRFLPAVTDVEIAISEDPDPIWSRVSGTFTKARDCEFAGIEWRLGVPGASVPLDFAFLEPSTVRSPGRQTFGPWRVRARPDQIDALVFAEVQHVCHPIWRTITRFYP